MLLPDKGCARGLSSFSAHTRPVLRIVILPKSQIANRWNCGPRPPHSTARVRELRRLGCAGIFLPAKNKASSEQCAKCPSVFYGRASSLSSRSSHVYATLLPARSAAGLLSHVGSGNCTYRGNPLNFAVIHNDCSTGSGGTACPTRI